MSLPYLRLLTLFIVSIFQPLTATSIKIEVSDDGHGQSGGKTVYAHTPFEVTVSVTDGDRDGGNIELVGPAQVKVMGTSQSTNISMVNGNVFSQTAHIYQLYTHQEGALKLGPARLKVGDRTIESNVLDLIVEKAPTQASSMSDSGKSQDEQSTAVLCRLTADKKNVVVGEPIVVRITILSRGQASQFVMEPPKFAGFIVKEIKKDIQRRENINNVMCNILEKRFVLTPSEQGKRTIEPIRVAYLAPVRNNHQRRGGFGDSLFSAFFDQERVEQKMVVSNALSITVDPLPEEQSQIDGVGEFTLLHASVDKHEAHVNEALNFKLVLEGKGNLEQIPTPRLILPPFIKAYESKSSIQEDLATDYHGGKKVFEYVVQIAQEGDAEIPAQQFTYFDTRSKTIKTLKTSGVVVHLTPGMQAQNPLISSDQEEEQEPSQTPQKVYKQDISFIQEDGPISSRSRDTGSGFGFFIFLLFVFLTPVAIFGKDLISRLVKRCLPGFLKGRIHKKKIISLQQELQGLCDRKQVDKLYQFFIKSLAVVSDSSVEVITHEWLHDYLSKEQWEEGKIEEFFDFINECAGCRFVSNLTQSKPDCDELFKQSFNWLLLLTSLKDSERLS